MGFRHLDMFSEYNWVHAKEERQFEYSFNQSTEHRIGGRERKNLSCQILLFTELMNYLEGKLQMRTLASFVNYTQIS